MSNVEKRFVYVLRSERDGRPYTGITCNVTQRLVTHNSGGSIHTAPHRPWRLAACVEFPTEAAALAFERYLKSGSGRAFARRHFR
jgi:putative endonuclease